MGVAPNRHVDHVRELLVFVSVLLGTGGCVVTTTRPPPQPNAQTRALATDVDVTETSSAEVPIGPPEAPDTIVQPVTVRLEECRGQTAGKVTARVRYIDGAFHYDIYPSSSLDPLQRDCVYDALTRMYTHDNPTMW